MIYWIAPAIRLAPYVLGGLSYLRSLLFPPAAPSESASSYVPPFTGGQCNTSYLVRIDFLIIASNTRNAPVLIATTVGRVTGSAPYENIAGSSGIKVFADGTVYDYNQNSNFYKDFKIVSITRADGSNVDCGNLPDPTGGGSVAQDGIATSAPPNLDAAPIVIEAVPPIILPSFAAALAAALAAARNALDALDAIKAVARALEALSDLLNKKNAEENKKEKEKKESQDTIRYEFGSIQKDGFLRLYPDSNLLKYVAQQLDISFVVIPPYLGKYFGKFSPNYYRHKPTSNLISSLGYIYFVSPTFGVLSTHHLEFRRTSIKVPENSIGFYYHLGLDGALTANAFAFYTKPKP